MLLRSFITLFLSLLLFLILSCLLQNLSLLSPSHSLPSLSLNTPSLPQAADHCARIGQLAIKWQKRIDRATRLPYPEDLAQLYKIIRETEAKKNKRSKDDNNDPFVLECSAKLAINPLEKICELMQLLSSYAMELPSCGFRYGLAVAGNANYMKIVESAMSSGLDAIKSVGALLSTEQQLNSCLNRIKEAKKYIFDFEKGDKMELKPENEGKKEVRTILIQMILSAFRGNSATVGIAAERAVNSVFIASELYGMAAGVIQQVGEERKTEAKKNVARKEEERQMCPEDREFLKGIFFSSKFLSISLISRFFTFIIHDNFFFCL